MSFQLSQSSIVHLMGVHPLLITLAKQTLLVSPYDFGIIYGLRTDQEEAAMVKAHKSETMHSRHLAGNDGYGHAIDFMAYADGVATWEPQYYIAVADAFRSTADKLSIPIEWGGAWTARLDQAVSAQTAYDTYVAARHAAGAEPFLDMDHIQLPADLYP